MSWNTFTSSPSAASSPSSHEKGGAGAGAIVGRGAGTSRGGGASGAGGAGGGNGGRERSDGSAPLREKLAAAQQRSLNGGHPNRVLLLGARGSGKSTLFKQLTQLKSSGYPSADRYATYAPLIL